MSTNIQLLKMQLSQLNERDQKQLFTYLQALLGISVDEKAIKPAVSSERAEELFYDVFSAQINKLLKTTCPPYSVIKKQAIYKELVELSNEVEQVVSRGFDKISTGERVRFYQILSSTIIGRISRMEVPLSVATFVRTSKGKVAGILDGAFPGYLRSGLMPLILKSNNMHGKHSL